MKFFGLLALALMSLPAFSQTCYVDMVHTQTGRVVRSFTAYGDQSTCIEGMKECRKSIRLDNLPYPAAVLDCVRDSRYNPAPTPVPTPNPYPQQPNPYRSVDATSLILDISNVVYSSEAKTKIIESLVATINSYNLAPLVRVCASTTSWQQNASCLVDGIQRAPREVVDENTAIVATGRACVKTTSWQDEANCFTAALRGNRLQSLGYLAQSCQNMYGSEQQSRCFRQVFGI